MKALLVLIVAELLLIEPLIVIAWAQIPASPKPLSCTYSSGYQDGRVSALHYNRPAAWFAGGFAGGLFLGPIGAIAVPAFASGNPEPPIWEIVRIDSLPSEYRIAFLRGYGVQASSDNVENAIGGGLVGMVVLLAIYYMAVKTSSK
jgi:hypothetical protein